MSSFLEKFNEEIKDESNGIVTETNELEEDKTYLKKKKKQKIITIIVSIVIVITISLLVIFSQIVEVPNFVNGLNTIATKWGKNNDIEIIEEEQYDTKITERIVISQSIKDGSRIFKKSSIKIIVSKGKDPNEKISVPEKDSATASDIKAWKEENDLSNVTIKEEHSSEIETGKIIKYEFENRKNSSDK